MADMVFTDPPYNVNYANRPRTRCAARIARSSTTTWATVLRLPAGGIDAHRGELPGRHLCGDVIQRAGCAAGRLRAAGGKWSTFIIWGQEHLHAGPRRYQRQYEPILYGWPEGAQRHWCVTAIRAMWAIKKPQKNDLHPTMKPVELVERAIRNSSRPGNVVLDPFGGSGTTLIAAENQVASRD